MTISLLNGAWDLLTSVFFNAASPTGFAPFEFQSGSRVSVLWRNRRSPYREHCLAFSSFPNHRPFTSHASRRPSPRKFNASKVATRTPPGNTINHQ